MSLQTIVDETVSTFGLNPKDSQLCLDFLLDTEPLDSEGPSRPIEEDMRKDKLQLFLYMMSKIPVALQDGERRISHIGDFQLFRYTNVDFRRPTHKNSPVRDEALYSWYMRVAQRSSRKQGPSVERLINEIGSHPRIVKRFERAISYDDVLAPNFVLIKYLSGEHPITIQRDSRRRRIRIRSPDDLWALRASTIKEGMDKALYALFQRVKAEHKQHGGPTWSELVDSVGRYASVVRHLGREIAYGDVGAPNAKSDRQLLLRYLMGEASVLTDEEQIVSKSIENLWVFQVHTYDKKAHPDPNLVKLLARAKRRKRYGTGLGFRELFDEVGKHRRAIRRYGRSVRFQDVFTQYRVHRRDLELEAYMLGEKTLKIEGIPKTIASVADMSFLRPFWKLADPNVEHIYRRIARRASATGLDIFDFIDRVGSRPKVVERYGRSITRDDVKTKLDRHTVLQRSLDRYGLRLQTYMLGEASIRIKDDTRTIASIADLPLLRPESNWDGDGIRKLNQRINRDIGEHHVGFYDLVDIVGSWPKVVERYGRAITRDDVKPKPDRNSVLQNHLHRYALQLQAYMVGDAGIKIEGEARTIASIADLPFLRPEWKSTDPNVRKLKQRIERHTPETGVYFYDLVDRFGAMPSIVERYGRPITRFDVNADIGKYEGKRVYSQTRALTRA